MGETGCVCLEESEKRMSTLKGGVQGRTRMTRAAFYLPALNQEGEEVPAESSEDEKSQPGANNNNKSNIPSRKYGTWEGATLPHFVEDGSILNKKKVAGRHYLSSNPWPLAWPLETGSVLTTRLPELELLLRAYWSQPWSGELGEGGQGSASPEAQDWKWAQLLNLLPLAEQEHMGLISGSQPWLHIRFTWEMFQCWCPGLIPDQLNVVSRSGSRHLYLLQLSHDSVTNMQSRLRTRLVFIIVF